MLTEFQDYLAASTKAMEALRTLCDAAQPDHPALTHARWQLAQLGRKRMTFLTEQVFPLAERHSGTKGGAGLLALRDTWPAFGRTVSAFLARWPVEAIASDWDGYRRDAASFRCEVAQRLKREEQSLREMLAEIDGPAASPSA